jgi:hypothetical protein
MDCLVSQWRDAPAAVLKWKLFHIAIDVAASSLD